MLHPLDSARAKLRRAHVKMEELDRAWEEFCGGDPPPVTFAPEVYPDDKEFRIVITEVREAPIEVGVIVGEIAHALRSVLDHLVWELAFVDSGCRGKGNDHTTFPLCGSPSAFSERRRSADVRGVSKAHVALIEMAQPYQPWYGGGGHPLRLIARLDNDDKHKVVQTVASTGGPWGIHIKGFRDCKQIPGSQASGFSPFGRHLEAGTVLWRQPVRITGPDPYVDVEVQIGLDCGLRDLTPIRLSLPVAAEYIEGILSLFEPAFEQSRIRNWHLREGRFPRKTQPQIEMPTGMTITPTPPAHWRAAPRRDRHDDSSDISAS